MLFKTFQEYSRELESTRIDRQTEVIITLQLVEICSKLERFTLIAILLFLWLIIEKCMIWKTYYIFNGKFIAKHSSENGFEMSCRPIERKKKSCTPAGFRKLHKVRKYIKENLHPKRTCNKSSKNNSAENVRVD